MYDYKLLEALAMVVRENGFEKAADKLCITQSAVSQRIKGLEELTGQILITRGSPPEPTVMGKRLIKHYHQVKRLEDELLHNDKPSSLSIGLNADSLATWFLPAINPYLEEENIFMELKVDDQDQTGLLLKNGEVAGCISSADSAIQGCNIHYLGKMEYALVSTPVFYRKWFKNGLSSGALEKAPAVIFNRRDKLHQQYLDQYADTVPENFPRHFVPSSEKFLTMILKGHSYGVVPLIQCREFLESRELTLVEEERIHVHLYWHHWKIDSRQIKQLTEVLLQYSKNYLS